MTTPNVHLQSNTDFPERLRDCVCHASSTSQKNKKTFLKQHFLFLLKMLINYKKEIDPNP
jgi:hypothetical protein